MSPHRHPQTSAEAAAAMSQHPCFRGTDPGTLKILLDLQQQILEVAQEKLGRGDAGNRAFTEYLVDMTETYFALIFATMEGADRESAKRVFEPLFGYCLSGALSAYAEANRDNLRQSPPDLTRHFNAIWTKAIVLAVRRKFTKLFKGEL